LCEGDIGKKDLFLKISELSKITGASIRSIRHYEKRNLLTSTRLDNGYREFDKSAIDRIKTIQIYLGLGLTTEQIEEIFNCMDTDINEDYDFFCDEMLRLYKDKLDEINSKVNALSVVKHRLEKQISQF
jgi:DNA-binding transcriptional MerR regulator